ncbi:myocardin-related transcription factor B isoform X2 [Acomys russatus]|uniref:myocardin-related transcription factor B isoform X2 n=1 Tax=Acomys russatus TaxID=60746 RepID=UPI0021E23281|nr:myocardin-related transcription factor B isoform X2 [Acomys russatus]
MDHTGAVDAEEELGPLAHLAPSPQSEAVAHELQELSLQSSQHLPSLNERKNVLQLRLQQRRTREQLVDQGIMPPLKSPAAFHEQIKSLERARTENFLKHKIRSRPDRSELVRMHILEETFAEPSLQATQMKLKRARLADDLNEKIAQRPGPMELVEKNILPVDSSVKEAIIGVVKEDYPQTHGEFSFDEDSSDALSPDQPASQESQGSAASPSEPKVSASPPPVTTNTPAQFTSVTPAVPEFLKTPLPADQPPTRSTAPVLPSNTVSSTKPGPTLVKQSHPKNPNDKHRSKKCKDPKPRVKKLKYHQYIPPSQKGERSEPHMDANYARLLQQQQLFLQLQILSQQQQQQQQQHYNYQTILPAPVKNDKNNSNSTTAPARKPGPLPSSLDDLKVSELKTELKLRGLPVSGTKPDLIERLKPYQEVTSSGLATGSIVAVSSAAIVTSNPEVTVALPVTTLHNAVTSSVSTFKADLPPSGPSNMPHIENAQSPLPISPSPSEQSSLSTDDTNMTDTFTEIMTMMSPSQFLCSSPLRVASHEDSLSPTSSTLSTLELDAAEKDRKLQEKEKQIEELKRKLEQEQKLVEVLKMQLEVEKRGQQRPPDPQPSGLAHPFSTSDQKHGSVGSSVKDEASLTDCSSPQQPIPVPGHSVGQPMSTGSQPLVAKKAVVIKQEVPMGHAEPQSVVSQFYVSSQGQPPALVAQPQALLTTQTTQLLLPVSIQGSSVTSVQLPVGSLQLQTPAQGGAQVQPQVAAATQIPAAALPSALAPALPQKQEAFPKHVLGQPQPVGKVFTNSAPSTVLQYQRQPGPATQQPFVSKSSSPVLQSRSTPLAPLQNGPSPASKPHSPSPPQQFVVQHSLFGTPVTKTKDPPRYEEAIKQTRSTQAALPEVSSAHSQQMDDLFDILIKSGEISFPIKEEPSPISTMKPVTASITTMPVNTVVSRPPPQVQVAPPVSLEPVNSLSASLENQLEAFLDGTLPPANDIAPVPSSSEDRGPFSLIEDLQNDLLSHSSMLYHSHSPMETSEAQLVAGTPCLSLDLSDSNLDNMEWLDITMPTTSSGLTPLSTTAPSMFSADFLDPQDLPLPWD